MRKRPVILILLGVVVAGAIIVLCRREREPEYGGKRLSEWVLELPSNASREGATASEMALRHIGTNSLPYLVEWITYEPAPWRLKLYESAAKFLKRAPYTLFQDKRMLRAAGAAKAFGALGREAAPATGKIIGIANDPKGRLSRTYANFALIAQKNGAQDIRVGARFGKDVFGLAFQTNGLPILTVSHTAFFLPMLTNPPVAPPAKLRNPGTNVLVKTDAPALERAIP